MGRCRRKRTFAGGGELALVASTLIAIMGASPSASAAEIDPAIAAHFAQYSLPTPNAGVVIICHGFGCAYRTEVALDPADHRKLAEILAKGRASPQAEREAVAQAVAWFDRRVGPVAGTTQRVALADFRHMGEAYQFDCVDASLNTTSALVVLQLLDLLKHHKVLAPVARGRGFDFRPLHATAVLIENAAPEQWSVDLWTRGYGQPPEIMQLSRWLQLDIWPWSNP